MGSLGPIHLIVLILVVAAVAGTAGFVAAPVVRRNRRRVRGFFVLGFVCGMTTAAVRRHKRRILRVIHSAALPVRERYRPRGVVTPSLGVLTGVCRETARRSAFSERTGWP
jgi:hypothetical protein